MVEKDVGFVINSKDLEKFYNQEFLNKIDRLEIEEMFKKMGVRKDIFIVEYETLENEIKKVAVKSYTKKMAIEKFEDYCTENKIDNVVDCWVEEV